MSRKVSWTFEILDKIIHQSSALSWFYRSIQEFQLFLSLNPKCILQNLFQQYAVAIV